MLCLAGHILYPVPLPAEHLIPSHDVSIPLASLDHPCPTPENLYKLHREDSDLLDIIYYLESIELPSDDKKAHSMLLPIDSFFLNDHGILCHLWTPGKRRVQRLCVQIVIPAALRHEVLVACHDHCTASHLGITKIRLRYYWPHIFKDIEHWCNSCVDCSMKKIPRRHRRAPLLPIPVEGAFDRVAMDIIRPFQTCMMRTVTSSCFRIIIRVGPRPLLCLQPKLPVSLKFSWMKFLLVMALLVHYFRIAGLTFSRQ